MSYPERGSRRITSIPPRTSLDVLRGRVAIRIGGGSLFGGTRRVSQEPIAGETDWSKIVAKHVFQKPPRQERARPEPHYEGDKIKLEMEVMEDYNNKGDLGIILQFPGIGFTREPFSKSRHDKTDSPVFYIPVSYNRRTALLFLATRGEILSSQIVPAQMNVNPFFQKELHISQLATAYNPASMTVLQNNKLVIVGYNQRNY